MAEAFFEEQAEHSQIKAAITAQYFLAYAQVMIGHQLAIREEPRVAYIDLFAGPGRYKDGAKSTPLFILEEAIKNDRLRQALRTIFNDKDDENTSSLKKEIALLPGIDTLRLQPQVNTSEVGEDIVKLFEAMNLIPSLIFVDPWGYKGLSLRLINSVLKNWACECLFFFNYNRVNMGLSNPAVKVHMEALFGEARAAKLMDQLKPLNPEQRELTIVEELTKALIELGGKYVVPFTFKNEGGTRTKHHLIFVSKHVRGARIVKQVMANQSSSSAQGVASFEYNPASAAYPLLSGFLRPLDALEGSLLEQFAGKTVSVEKVIEDHSMVQPYTDKNYKDVLTAMEQQGKVTADPPYNKRVKRKGEITCADRTVFAFPHQQ